MFSPDQYELLDMGAGRRLERFGTCVLDRPAPAAERSRQREPSLWASAVARFKRKTAAQGTWSFAKQHANCLRSKEDLWQMRHGLLVLELKCTDSGAIGVYPEQAPNWDWIEKQIRRARRPLRVLNLFAYTGGSTLAAAAAGAEVVHVDAARSVVKWARRNAELSGLSDAPIRWIVEDARRFAERELRRGVKYDAVILDPPTYGHGPKSEPWKLSEHLGDLLKTIGTLTAESREFVLLTSHAPSTGPADLEAMLAEHLFGHCQGGVVARSLNLTNEYGQRLPSGVVTRWPGC